MRSSEATLRPYRPTDFETIYRIDKTCFPRGIAYERDELRTYLHGYGTYCLLAEAPGTESTSEVAGFILTHRSGKTAHIITLDVLEPYRRRGLGSLMLRAAEREAVSQGITRIYLETAINNKAAIALWQKHGYCKSATIKNYYGRDLDAFEMVKGLAPVPNSSST